MGRELGGAPEMSSQLACGFISQRQGCATGPLLVGPGALLAVEKKEVGTWELGGSLAQIWSLWPTRRGGRLGARQPLRRKGWDRGWHVRGKQDLRGHDENVQVGPPAHCGHVLCAGPGLAQQEAL